MSHHLAMTTLHAPMQSVGMLVQVKHLMRCARHTALERQDLSRTYLAHHELEREFIIVYYYKVFVICYYSPLSNICNLSIITT